MRPLYVSHRRDELLSKLGPLYVSGLSLRRIGTDLRCYRPAELLPPEKLAMAGGKRKRSSLSRAVTISYGGGRPSASTRAIRNVQVYVNQTAAQKDRETRIRAQQIAGMSSAARDCTPRLFDSASTLTSV
jgi:hypothetical protein